jgi:hypothetical protein
MINTNSFSQIPFHSNKVFESKVRSNDNGSIPHVNAVETQRPRIGISFMQHENDSQDIFAAGARAE